ncbi:MAG: hypothetical protein Q9211_001635 [Gyalolechia sp. 1 TL-2023]
MSFPRQYVLQDASSTGTIARWISRARRIVIERGSHTVHYSEMQQIAIGDRPPSPMLDIILIVLISTYRVIRKTCVAFSRTPTNASGRCFDNARF